MGKPTGGTRYVKPSDASKAKNLTDFNNRMATGFYDTSKSFVSAVSGAYVAYMTGHNYFPEEIEAARYLADAGFNVVLTPEGNGYEGTVSQITFEQTTPKSITNTAETTIKNAIKHANTKRSNIALIYDKNSLFHREDIEKGMKAYQKSDKAWQKKVKAVLVVNSKGEVWEHQFDK